MGIIIDEASNGWLIRSGESRKEPRVFEFDGANRFRTNLENIVKTAERAMQFVLEEMVGSAHYKVVIMEDTDDQSTSVPAAGDLSVQAHPGGLRLPGKMDAQEVSS